MPIRRQGTGSASVVPFASGRARSLHCPDQEDQAHDNGQSTDHNLGRRGRDKLPDLVGHRRSPGKQAHRVQTPQRLVGSLGIGGILAASLRHCCDSAETRRRHCGTDCLAVGAGSGVTTPQASPRRVPARPGGPPGAAARRSEHCEISRVGRVLLRSVEDSRCARPSVVGPVLSWKSILSPATAHLRGVDAGGKNFRGRSVSKISRRRFLAHCGGSEPCVGDQHGGPGKSSAGPGSMLRSSRAYPEGSFRELST